jgi:hypothetical protein
VLYGHEEARKVFVVAEIDNTVFLGYVYCFEVHLLIDKWGNEGRGVSTPFTFAVLANDTSCSPSLLDCGYSILVLHR